MHLYLVDLICGQCVLKGPTDGIRLPRNVHETSTAVRRDRDSEWPEADNKVETGQRGSDEIRPIQIRALGEICYEILQALKELGALSEVTRKTGAEVARRCRKQSDFSSFKAPNARLAKLELIKSKTGRGGGSWLTPNGNTFTEQLITQRLPKR